MLENFEEAMERTGGVTGAQRKKPKTNDGQGQSATKLHRLLDMFKVGGGGGDVVVVVVQRSCSWSCSC